MRVLSLALVSLVVPSASAFVVPPTAPAFTRVSNNNELQMSLQTDIQKAALSVFTGVVIATSAIALPPTTEPAFAAADKTPVATTTTTTTTATTKTKSSSSKTTPPAVVVPTEKKALTNAKINLESAQQQLTAVQKSYSTAKAADDKAATGLTGAERKADLKKRELISANDKLVEAKSKSKDLKFVEGLADKVGAARISLKSAETELKTAKSARTQTSKVLSSVNSQIKSSEKIMNDAKKNIKKAEDGVKKYNKRTAEQAKKDAAMKKKKAEQAKKDAATLKKKEKKVADAKAKTIKKKQEQIKALSKEKAKASSQENLSKKSIQTSEAKLTKELKELEKLKSGSKK